MVHFGRCPRVHCQGQPALPVGQSDLPRMHTTKIFCCRCEDIYYPRSSRQANVDGAYFGTTFCHLFMQSYWEMKPTPPGSLYVPRIFGFKIHRPDGPTITSLGRATALASSSSSSNAKGGIGGSGSRCTTASVAASGGSGNAPPSSAGASTAKSSCGRQEDDPKWKHRTPEQQHEAQGRSSFASTKRGVVPGLNDGDEIAAG